jgi:hypothetical protein
MPAMDFPLPVLSIHGAPRSGTSWLGEILNSHPGVAYRYQPLFAWAFQGRLTPHSTRDEVHQLLGEWLETDDDFVLQRGSARLGRTPDFPDKDEKPSLLVTKMVRHHHLLPLLFDCVPGLRVIGIVRNPCAVVNSFLRTSREWRPEWDPDLEWREAPSKNDGRPEQYYGFEGWKRLASQFLALAAQRPGSFLDLRYEALVTDPRRQVERVFAFAGLSVGDQTRAFVEDSSSDPDRGHDHGVFKHPDVVHRWRDELAPRIREAIHEDLAGGPLERFLRDPEPGGGF